MHKQTNQVYYTGQWFNEGPNGIGIMTCANYEFANLQSKELQWTKYEGEFTNGYFNGKGKLYLSNGDIFYGQFAEGSISGNGLVKNQSKTIVGKWERNELKVRML